MKTLVVSVVLALCGVAAAYPQYQLQSDATCTGCHLSPDGGGILNENGTNTAEANAWRPGDGRWMYGMHKPDWLELGGDVRGAAGFVDPGTTTVNAYPMQIEVAASAKLGAGFSIHALGGIRRPEDGGSPIHVLWSREHYVMWQQNPESNEGLYIRVGRLTPTYGLRLAEHTVYTQMYGGYPLYDEAYAVAASYVTHAFELHATGFVHDPIASAVEHGDGGALYAEARIGEHAAIGAEGKYSSATDAHRTYGGVTGKLYVEGAKLLILGEAEVIHQDVVAASDKYNQIAAYLLGSRPLGGGFLLDVGLGHFTQDTRVKGLFRDALDINVHWFMTSHVEWLLTVQAELLDFGSHTNGGYALAQLHYRL